MRFPSAELDRARAEQDRRIDRAIATFRVRHMNDTKWREIFSLLRTDAKEIGCVRFKFVDSEHVIESNGRMTPVSDSWCDGFPGPFQYREIQWLELPNQYSVKVGNEGTPRQIRLQQTSRFRDAIMKLGQVRIVDTPDGYRIVGYE